MQQSSFSRRGLYVAMLLTLVGCASEPDNKPI